MASPPTYASALVLTSLLLLASGVQADASSSGAASTPSQNGAAAAFDRGVAAYQAGDFEAAALQFVSADAQAPSVTSLANALAAAESAAKKEAAAWPLAATIASRMLTREGAPSDATAKARAVMTEATPHVAELKLSCEDGPSCVLHVDDAPFAGLDVYVVPGVHGITRAGSEEPARTVDCAAAAVCALSWPASVAAAEGESVVETEAAPSSAKWQRHVPIAVFGVSAVAALTFAGLATWQGVLAVHSNDRYDHDREAYSEDDTKGFARRTDYLIGASVLATGAAVASALWWVDWKSYRNTSVAVLPKSGFFVAHRVQF